MGKKVLVVDDDRYICYLFRDVLTENDYEVKCAEDGGEAIRIYREFLPQLVILDVIMPGKEGVETITELKKLNPDIKVIAVSGGHRANAKKYLEMMKNFGANRVFEKPVPLDQLVDAVDDLLFGSTAF